MESEETKSIYDMDLHDVIRLTNISWVTRVPGGWMYKTTSVGEGIGCCFVPYHAEYKPSLHSISAEEAGITGE